MLKSLICLSIDMDKCSSGTFWNGQMELGDLWASEMGRPMDIWRVTERTSTFKMDWTGSTSIEFLERLFFFLSRFETSKIEKAQFAIWGNRKQIFNVHSYPTSVSVSIRLSWNFTGKRVSRSVIVVGFRFRRVKASNRIHPNRFLLPT